METALYLIARSLITLLQALWAGSAGHWPTGLMRVIDVGR